MLIHGAFSSTVGLADAKHGFVLFPDAGPLSVQLPGWAQLFAVSACDYERLPETLAGFHFLAFAILLYSVLLSLWGFST
jgi:hypothetical protein